MTYNPSLGRPAVTCGQPWVGRALLMLRTFHGVRVVDIAEHCGVGETTVRRWEKDGQEPRPEQLRALANMFGVEPEAFGREPEVT